MHKRNVALFEFKMSFRDEFQISWNFVCPGISILTRLFEVYLADFQIIPECNKVACGGENTRQLSDLRTRTILLETLVVTTQQTPVIPGRNIQKRIERIELNYLRFSYHTEICQASRQSCRHRFDAIMTLLFRHVFAEMTPYMRTKCLVEYKNRPILTQKSVKNLCVNSPMFETVSSRRRHGMEKFSALLSLYEGYSPTNKLLNKQSSLRNWSQISYNALNKKYPTMLHFVRSMNISSTKMVQCGIWDWCIVGFVMMTSSNGNIFRVTGHLCGEFIGPRWIPAQSPVTRSFDVFFDLRPNKRLTKQSWGCWSETPSCSLWRQCDAYIEGRGEVAVV